MKAEKSFPFVALLLAGSLVVAPILAHATESPKREDKAHEKQLEVIFKQVDQDGDGHLSLKEVKDFARFLHAMKAMMHHGYHDEHEEREEESPNAD